MEKLAQNVRNARASPNMNGCDSCQCIYINMTSVGSILQYNLPVALILSIIFSPFGRATLGPSIEVS